MIRVPIDSLFQSNQVDRKVRHVIWTSFQNKLLLEVLNIDAVDLCTGLHRGVDTPNM